MTAFFNEFIIFVHVFSLIYIHGRLPDRTGGRGSAYYTLEDQKYKYICIEILKKSMTYFQSCTKTRINYNNILQNRKINTTGYFLLFFYLRPTNFLFAFPLNFFLRTPMRPSLKQNNEVNGANEK